MKKVVFGALLLLALPIVAPAQQIDPLSAAFSPTIDEKPAHYPSNIWITGPLEKVRQDSGAPGTIHWAIVYATQNEIQSFQVHVQAPSAGISNLNVTMSNLVQTAPSSYTIAASSTDVVVYREGYMHVYPQVTATSSTYYGSTGYYPDPLIPAVDPYHHQKTNAFPFTVAGENNQSVWIDVHVPPSAPSGYYLGTVTVSSGSTTLATMPVLYAVWRWPSSAGGHMPSTDTLGWTSAIGYSSLCHQQGGSCNSIYPGGAEGEAVDLGAMLLDNRTNNAGGGQNFPDTGSFSSFDTQQGPLLNGTAGWHVNTILPGAKYSSMNLQCAGGCFNTGINTKAIFSKWVREFSTKGWLPMLVYGLADEPSGGAWTSLVSNANASRGYSTPMVPLQVTTDLANATANNALNTIDQMVVLVNDMEPTSGNRRSTYNAWLSGKCCGGSGPARTLWSYQSCSSSGTCGNGRVGSGVTYPNYDVDGRAVANRAMEWMTFRNSESGELYYLLDFCFDQSCGYPTSSSDPWISVYAFGGWGDGTLLYPGTTARLGKGVTTPIWLPSLRLKMIRDGMQDYEYLNLLTNQGKGSFVQTEISTWITNAHTFNVNPIGLSNARQALGNAMHQLTYPVVLRPPAKLAGAPQ
jgi:hypothetical protein